MMRPAAILALATLVGLAPRVAPAQHVTGCDGWQTSARNIDWSDPTRTFANDAIRLVGLDTAEPAAAAFHIMVTYPDAEGAFLDCRLISLGEGVGFGAISLERAIAAYDSVRGLTVTVPGLSADGEALVITFSVNRVTGEVTVP
ncbi:MAG: hypothetical protein WBA67_10920 [Jannaschia sp.]